MANVHVRPVRRALRWRRATAADLPTCLDIQPVHMGADIVGEQRARELWLQLINHPFCMSAVFESDDCRGMPRIVGFGASVFVSAAFAAAELRDPRPGLNSRVIASLDRGPRVLLTIDEIARGNAGTGLDLVVLYGSWPEQQLAPDCLLELQMMLVSSIVQLHAGYKLRVMLSIAAGEQVLYRRRSGVVTELATFAELNQVYNVIRAPQVDSNQSSLAAQLFHYRAPVLGLSDCEKELLAQALDGATDGDLAEAIGLSVPAVKARWRSIYARFARVDPDYDDEAVERDHRGPQKRHRVLSYVRQHAEELRPYCQHHESAAR